MFVLVEYPATEFNLILNANEVRSIKKFEYKQEGIYQFRIYYKGENKEYNSEYFEFTSKDERDRLFQILFEALNYKVEDI
jgi:hypothetical protein